MFLYGDGVDESKDENEDAEVDSSFNVLIAELELELELALPPLPGVLLIRPGRFPPPPEFGIGVVVRMCGDTPTPMPMPVLPNCCANAKDREDPSTPTVVVLASAFVPKVGDKGTKWNGTKSHVRMSVGTRRNTRQQNTTQQNKK